MTATLASKTCLACRTPLARRGDEKASAYTKRRYCDAQCRAAGLASHTPDQTCLACHQPFPRRDGEARGDYRRRSYCDATCRATGRHAARKTVAPVPGADTPLTLDWQRRGACVGIDQPDRFHPDTSGPTPRSLTDLCHGCPVLAECFAWALEHESYGVWGGVNWQAVTRAERDAYRAARVAS